MLTALRVVMARIRGFLRPGDLDREFDQELAAHLAMAEEDRVRQGMPRQEARRLARVELGGLTQLREAGRAARGLPWLGTFWLDIKLGLRMLRKSWGLTLVGGLAMSVAIGIGAMVFALFDVAYSGTLPLEEGDRVVALQTWDDKAQQRHSTSLPDFERWRDRLRSVEEVGAFQTLERNLIIADSPAAPVAIAEMTASGFQLARVAPLLGRPLTPEDERLTAAPVVVIGYDVWQTRFSADPAVLGQTLRFGDTVHTVVGVMPQDFAFPVNHRFWTPLRPDRSASPGGEVSLEVIFARLAPGFTLESAQAELTTLGLLPGAVATAEDEQLRPRVLPYIFGVYDDTEREVRWLSRIILLFVAFLLLPPCANIAILVYARTVTRQEEFAARYVLGASRARIVLQIFLEVLVIAAGASGVALVAVRLAAWKMQERHPDVPFWMDFTLSSNTVLFTAVLAVLAAMIAGGVPALRATGGQMQSGLRALSSRTGMQLGATWTALVVAQVAFSAAALPSAVEMAWGTLRTGVLGPGFAAEEYLTARIELDRKSLANPVSANPVSANPVPANPESVSGVAEGEPHLGASRFGVLQAELVRQLKAEPGVSRVTVAATAPGQEPWRAIEVEGAPQQEAGIFATNLVQFNHVDEVFFEVFDNPILIGRGFDAGDFESESTVVIIDQAFAERHIGPVNPLGHRIRYLRGNREEAATASGAAAPESATWYEIVGVVADLPAHTVNGRMYHPLVTGQTHPASLVLRTGPPPASLAEPLREITTALDPTLRIEEILPLDEIYREQAVGNNLGASVLAMITLSVLLLSGAGLYALMSFTVNQRRREIGIRSALGAGPRRLLAGIFRRALGQVAVGALVGTLVAFLLNNYLPMELLGGWNVPGIIPAAALFMMIIGLLATAGPARRGLRVDPIEELREG